MTVVPVPGIPGPYRQLCWQQDPVRLLRCDRARNHNGLHSWEWAAITTALAEAEADLAALTAQTCDNDETREYVFTAGWQSARQERPAEYQETEHELRHSAYLYWAAKETP